MIGIGIKGRIMSTLTARSAGDRILLEIQEFAMFPRAAQRYIRRSLAVRYGCRNDLARFARNCEEAASIAAQARVYDQLAQMGSTIAPDAEFASIDPLMSPLISATTFDLGEKRLATFNAYRFLYERLVGASVRPWLLSVFCAAATLPHLHPTLRLALLQSIDRGTAGAPGWSSREPLFFPEWIEQLDD